MALFKTTYNRKIKRSFSFYANKQSSEKPQTQPSEKIHKNSFPLNTYLK